MRAARACRNAMADCSAAASRRLRLSRCDAVSQVVYSSGARSPQAGAWDADNRFADSPFGATNARRLHSSSRFASGQKANTQVLIQQSLLAEELDNRDAVARTEGELLDCEDCPGPASWTGCNRSRTGDNESTPAVAPHGTLSGGCQPAESPKCSHSARSKDAVIPREAKRSRGIHPAPPRHSARSEAQSRNPRPAPHSPGTEIRRWHPRQGRLMRYFRTQPLTRSRKSVMGSILCHRGHGGHGEIRLMPSTSRDSLKLSSSPRFSVAFKYGVWKRL
jgi:hypothetical protein